VHYYNFIAPDKSWDNGHTSLAPYTESRLTCSVANERVGFPVVEYEEISLNRLAHVVDEKLIPPFKIDILWAMGDSFPDLVPTHFLFGSYPVPSPHGASYVLPTVYGFFLIVPARHPK
jgi:hypothetical protein